MIEPSVDLAFIEEAVATIGRTPDKVVPLLQAIQEHYRYLPPEAMRRVCELTDITPAQIAGVSSFYSRFRRHPAGKHTIRVCVGTACHVKGSGAVLDSFRRYLKIDDGSDTDATRTFTVETVACLGCCTLAPAVQVDDTTYGYVAPDTIPKLLRDFLASQSEPGVLRPGRAAAARESRGEIRIGVGSCCVAKGSGKVRDALEQAAAGVGTGVRVKSVGCVGMCHQAPLVEVALPGHGSFLYARVRAEDAEGIVGRHFAPRTAAGKVGRRISGMFDRLLTDETWEPVTRYAIDVRDKPVSSFLSLQQRIVTEHSGALDPLDLDEYLSRGGFTALRRCLESMSPDQVIAAVRESGLGGRGGAGYPTGLKWRQVRDAPGESRYVICNGDEGDPGAFMDRMVLESFPYRVIEGIGIAAYAVGAPEGVLFIRAEYPLALRRIREALRRCEERGLMGNAAPGGALRLQLRVVEGAGAFVCGEETALIAAVEGQRGMPHYRPPYPARSGLWGKPTLVNNVETYASVPWIIRHGAGAFAAIGTSDSKGTKVFALAGKVERAGLIEVPMGVSIRQIVEDIGGGAAGGKRFKAVQIGGPSGGCIPADLSDVAVDYKSLTGLGAIMGSGGFVVLDEGDCMVEMARYFLAFTQDQSCGKCTFCRIGTRRMLDILERLCGGRGKKGDIEEIERLGSMIKQGSLCGLGKTAPNPVLSTLRYFREEYEAHLNGRCPAGRCRALIRYAITDDCIGCTLCAQRCPADAIPMRPYEKHEIDQSKCVKCDTCRRVCPAEAVKVE